MKSYVSLCPNQLIHVGSVSYLGVAGDIYSAKGLKGFEGYKLLKVFTR